MESPASAPRVVGLTGGIACGKSTVARLLGDRGVAVVDADAVAREIVEPGEPAYDEIVAEFGRGVLDAQGRIDRKKLATEVFGDERARSRLNSITHPRIGVRSRQRIDELGRRGHEIVVYDAALLVETGLYRGLDALLVVAASRRTQIERLVERDGLTEHEARARIDAQMLIDKKVEVTDAVVRNDGPLDELGAKVDAAWNGILRTLATRKGTR